MFSSRRVACTRHADTRETDQVKQPAVFRLLDGGERERERRNWCALRGRRPHDKCIRAGRHAANEGRLRSFLPSFVSKVEACTRVKGSADGHGITALPASKSIFLLFLSLPFDRSNRSNVLFPRTTLILVAQPSIETVARSAKRSREETIRSDKSLTVARRVVSLARGSNFARRVELVVSFFSFFRFFKDK